ncbi:MAG: HIT domain-containing protein [Candidatus Vogelbacteria bacterium]|nr:HIT domain-containing protein [Candidatus Vogelbacteria bacterium]
MKAQSSKHKTPKNFVDLNNARPGHSYHSVISNIVKDGVCPFCPDKLAKYHKNPIEMKGKFWLVTKNMYPYTAVKHHLLLIHKKHIEHISEITKDAWLELQRTIKKLSKQKNVQGGSLMLRFGDTHFTGASVNHLHAHIIQSDPDHKEYKNPKTMPGVIARVG